MDATTDISQFLFGMRMSGIGKTAVANNVYCDGSINFHLKIWVYVMIDYATLPPCNLSDFPSLQRVLENILYCKKFLLVLNDYWSENYDALSESVLEEVKSL